MKKKLCVVLADYYDDVTDLLVKGASEKIMKAESKGIIKKVESERDIGMFNHVSGVFEIPAIISKLIPSINTLGFDRFSARERLASVFYNKTFNCSYETNVIERNLSLMEYALGVSFKIKEIHNKVPFLFSNEQILKIPITKPKKKKDAANITKYKEPILWAIIKHTIDPTKASIPNAMLFEPLAIKNILSTFRE